MIKETFNNAYGLINPAFFQTIAFRQSGSRSVIYEQHMNNSISVFLFFLKYTCLRIYRLLQGLIPDLDNQHILTEVF